jgi:hypothetical protein
MEEIGLEWSWLADLTAYKLENKQLLYKLDLPELEFLKSLWGPGTEEE